MTLELTDGAKDELDRLRDLTEAASSAEVIRRALAFYAVLVEQSKDGARFEVVDSEGGRRELMVIP